MASSPISSPAKLDRMKLGILIVAVLFVVMPFLFWRATWFGAPLTDAEMRENFADAEHPRKTQHALTQVAERMTSRDPQVQASARQWYAQVIAAASHPKDQIRLTAAWVMGQDNTAQEFREPLHKLLEDSNPMVRHNAALSLVRFGDAVGHDDIVAMLRPYAMPAPDSGTLTQRLQPGDVVNPGTLVGRIKPSVGADPRARPSADEIEVRSKVAGRVERWLVNDGAAIKSGDAIVSISPSAEMVWEALRALALIGRPEDIPLIEPYTRSQPDMPASIAKQAEETIRRIRQNESTPRQSLLISQSGKSTETPETICRPEIYFMMVEPPANYQGKLKKGKLVGDRFIDGGVKLLEAPVPESLARKACGKSFLFNLLLKESGEVGRAVSPDLKVELDRDVADAIQKGWKFAPPRVSGVPVTTIVMTRITFKEPQASPPRKPGNSETLRTKPPNSV